MSTAVTLSDIERVFDILAEFGLSREAVFIPLKPAQPGRVQMRPDNRLEIVFDSGMSLDEWLAVVRQRVREIIASPAGARLKREVD
jgi:hypothetical protein